MVLLRPSRSLTPRSASNQRSNFEAKRLSETQLGRKVHKMCTSGMGLELRIYFQFSPHLAFGDPSPTPSAVGNRCSSINCIASSDPLIRCKGRKPVAVLVVICRLQYFSSSRHYYDGCAAGGRLKKFVEERCPEYVGMTERSASSSRRCARIAPPVYECSEEKRRSTTCR